MRDIKKYSAWDIMDQLKKEASPLIKNFTCYIKECQKHRFWMPRFDDDVIRDQKMLWTKIKYIHNNPVEAGIVGNPKDFKYSSARNYILNDQSVLYVEKSWVGIEII
jgi:REP element-mobilizing transposase RayT